MLSRTKIFKILTALTFVIAVVTAAASARQMRNDMPFTCKYEAKRNFAVSVRNSQTLPVERTHNGFIVYGQSPKNTSRALFYVCRFNKWGEYRGIRKTSDKRYSGRGDANHRVPRTAGRVCKGEASARWRMRPNVIRISKVKRVGRNDYIVKLAARNYRGKCEVSGAGHIYRFKTHYANGNAGSTTPREAVWSCKRRAASRWGVRPDRIRTARTRRLGRDDYNVKLSFRNYRADCEVSRRGRIYFFSEY